MAYLIPVRVRGSGGGRGLREDSGIKFYYMQIKHSNNWPA